jgi:hypothetical protein
MRFFTFTLLTKDGDVLMETRGASPAITFTCIDVVLFLSRPAVAGTIIAFCFSIIVNVIAETVPIALSSTELNLTFPPSITSINTEQFPVHDIETQLQLNANLASNSADEYFPSASGS